ncbi:MAG: RimK family alpha-L-glutamate ligase [Promethearchaeota archaeon]
MSNQLDAYPTQRLLEECESLNLDGLFIKTSLVRLRVRQDPGVSFNAYYLGRSLNDLDVVIPRIGSSMTSVGELIIRHFKGMGIPTTVSALAIHIARDKYLTIQKLALNGIPVPETILVNSFLQSMDLLTIRNLPIILKPRNLFHGLGVVKVNDLKFLLEISEALISISSPSRRSIMIQEFIEHKKPHQDYRLFVINDKVIAAMTRTANHPDQWRTNVARGASVSEYNPTSEEKQLAVEATRILRLKIAGVDIIQDKDKNPFILEVNPCPGWKGIEEATGKNIAQDIIRYALDLAKKDEY